MEQEEDVVDSALFCKALNNKKVPSIEALNSEMPGKGLQKDKGRKLLKGLLNRLRMRRYASVTISKPDPSYRVAYLGNVVTGWAKGRGFSFLLEVLISFGQAVITKSYITNNLAVIF